MSAIREKLLEASYFYQKVKDCFSGKLHQEMQFNLNAFISAVRSITWVMKNEFLKYDGFTEWFEEAKQKYMNKNAFQNLNELRITSEKKKSIRPMYVQTVRFKEPVNINSEQSLEIFTNCEERVSAAIYSNNNESIKLNGDQFNVNLSCRFEEIPNEDLFKFCEQYLESSQKMVEECEKKFKQKTPT